MLTHAPRIGIMAVVAVCALVSAASCSTGAAPDTSPTAGEDADSSMAPSSDGSLAAEGAATTNADGGAAEATTGDAAVSSDAATDGAASSDASDASLDSPSVSDAADAVSGYPTCDAAPKCDPATTYADEACGRCGYRQRICTLSCEFVSGLPCLNEGECAKGTSTWVADGLCASPDGGPMGHIKTCDSTCQYVTAAACVPPP